MGHSEPQSFIRADGLAKSYFQGNTVAISVLSTYNTTWHITHEHLRIFRCIHMPDAIVLLRKKMGTSRNKLFEKAGKANRLGEK